MPKEIRTEVGEIHPIFWQKTVKEAFKNDPLRIIIELIKNAADSYTRLEKGNKTKPPYKILVKVFCRKNNRPFIEVKDDAEGMNSIKLRNALKYGTQTSMGEDTEAVTSAEKGIGLKDAMMSLKNNWLITIKDGMINERNKHHDFRTGIGKEDERVTKKERDELGILNNGTLIKGQLPDYFHDKKFITICERLQQHFLMRKLLQSSDYQICVIDGWSKEERLLRYQPSEIDKPLLKEKFGIKYDGKDYQIGITINKSKEALPQGKPYGNSGLIFFYGKYSVIDFSLCRFERDISFSKIFGEVKMEIEKLIRDPDESPLVDEKRRGLDQTHPFNIKLIDEINKRLKNIQEEEEESKYSLDETAKKEILKELNKIYKEIKGKGQRPEPPIKPEFFEFYPVYADIKEYEPKKVFLVINSSIIIDKLEINLQSKNSKIIVKPTTIKIEKEKTKEEFIIKQIELYSEEAKNKGEAIAVSENLNHSSKVGIQVLENPIFSPENGFAFVPNKTTVVDGGDKKVDLCIKKNIITGKEILLTHQNPINCPGKWILPDPKNLRIKIIKDILKEEIPIKVKGTDHIGEKATITATYGDKISTIDITVVPEPSFGGPFRDIRLSAKDTKKISSFIEEEGVLEIYYKHPLMKKYMQKNFKNKPDFLVFTTDIITRECVKAAVLSAVKESSSKFPIFNLDRPEPEVENYIVVEYYEQGPKMHELFVKLARTFSIGE